MDRQNVFGAGVIGHGNGLFGRAMRADPGLIGTDRHERQSERTFLSQEPEAVSHGGVAAEDNFAAFAFDDVAVVAAMAVVLPASAPMVDLKGFDLDAPIGGGQGGFVAPTKLTHGLELCVAQEIAGGSGRDNASRSGQTA